jgi:predicted membrane protein
MHKSQSSSLFWGLMLVALGGLIFLHNTDILHFDEIISDYWPLLIVVLGVYIILQSYRKSTRPSGSDFGNRQVITDSEEVLQSNTFGDVKTVLESKDFQGGRISTTFGNIKLGATKVKVLHGEKRLILNTTFGDIKVEAPGDLPIKVTADNVAGDMKIFQQTRSGFGQHISHKTDGYDEADGKLHIICHLTFGTIKVW